MTNTIQTAHFGIDIEYREATNRWHFMLRNRERSAASLLEAKEIIEKPVKDKKPFERQRVFRQAYDSWSVVTVTSIGETNYRGQNVWIIDSDGERTKVCLDNLFVDNPENKMRYDRIQKLMQRIKGFKQEVNQLAKQMEPFTVPEEP